MVAILKSILHLFYPETCVVCRADLSINEVVICTVCQLELPRTYYSKTNENEVEKSFYGRIPVEAATSLYYFSKRGKVQELIHQLKYKNQQKIGEFTGEILGNAMLESKRFTNLDAIVPVPLHPKKLKKRGYNQVTTFGMKLSEILAIPYLENTLVKVNATKTQTFKSRLDRSKNVDHKFDLCHKENLEGKHILLIDDVITTGATLEACCIQLLKIKNIKISIATIAYTN